MHQPPKLQRVVTLGSGSLDQSPKDIDPVENDLRIAAELVGYLFSSACRHLSSRHGHLPGSCASLEFALDAKPDER